MIPLAVVLVILVLIALIPAGVRLQYDDGALRVQVAAWRLHIQVYPRQVDEVKAAKKMARQRRKQANKKPSKPKKEKPAKKDKPQGEKKLTPETIQSLVKMGLDLVGQLPKKLLIQDLIVHVVFGGRNAAEIAVGYGKAWAVIGAVTPVLENAFRIRNRDIQAILDPDRERMGVYLMLDIRMRVGTALWLGLKAAFGLLNIMMKNKKKAVHTNESSSV